MPPSAHAVAPLSAAVRRYAVGVGLAALVAVVVGVLAFPLDAPLDLPRLVFSTVAVVVTASVSIDLWLRDTNRKITLDEIGYGICLALLPPVGVMVAGIVGTTVEQVLHRRGAVKAVFNIGQVAISMVVAGAIVALVDAGSFSLLHVLAILGAVMANGLVNIGLFIGIASRMSGAPGRVLLREEVGASLVTTAIGGGVGVLAAYFYVHDPMLLPLVAGPAFLARTHTAARRREADAMAAERDRLSRAIEGVTDGIALVDADGHLVLANESFLRLVGPIKVGHGVCPWLRLTTSDGQVIGMPETAPSGGVSVSEGQLRGRTVRVVRQAMRDGSHRTGEVIQIRDVTREREVAQLREDFVSRVSHELRTPLTSITGAIDTLVARRDVLAPAQAAELLDAAQRNGARLERLVSSLLVRARIERRGMGSTRADVELRPVVASVLDEVLEVAHRCEVPAGLTAHVDPDHLRQMLENLAVNAEKYGAPPVVVRGARDGDLVELRVIDAGPGVADDFVAKLFDPFTQASTGTRREARGLGLGLDIVRSLATTNGGAVRYEPGHGGACFVLSLPAEPHRVDRRVATPAG